MHVIHAHDVNEALPLAMMFLKANGRDRMSRNGMVCEYPEPVTTVYTRPDQCVLVDADRDANPFYHFFESLWILAGEEDVATLSFFLPSIAKFSDDGVLFHGAYGHRLRKHFDGMDQLDMAVRLIKADCDTRRVALSIYDASYDLGVVSKDVPCNCMILFKQYSGRLDMTVFNRSNDVIWGAYGANAVQFGFLMMYVAARTGLSLGKYRQVSDSLHAYHWNDFWARTHEKGYPPVCPRNDTYDSLGFRVTAFDLMDHPQDLDNDLRVLMDAIRHKDILTQNPHYANRLFTNVAKPMLAAFRLHKSGNTKMAINVCQYIEADDWRFACTQWLTRRMLRKGEEA